MAGVYAAVATGLGGYNAARFLATRAIKKRRERRERRRQRNLLYGIFAKAEKTYKRLNLGDLDDEAVDDVVALVKAKLGSK